MRTPTAVFSSRQITALCPAPAAATAASIAAMRASKSGSGLRCSQPRTRCTRMWASRSTRPTQQALTGRTGPLPAVAAGPAAASWLLTRSARRACVQHPHGRGGWLVAVAATARRWASL